MKEIVTKNYSTDGGDTWVIGGKLIVQGGAEVEGIVGVEAQAAKQTDLAGTAELADVITAFNALLAAMKTAGLMAST